MEYTHVKLRIVAPVAAQGVIQEVLAEAGAGRQGNYSHCAFVYPVTGYFKPLIGAHPAIGTLGQVEQVEEVVIETMCPVSIAKSVVEVIKKVHPYEEPVIDIVPLLELE